MHGVQKQAPLIRALGVQLNESADRLSGRVLIKKKRRKKLPAGEATTEKRMLGRVLSLSPLEEGLPLRHVCRDTGIFTVSPFRFSKLKRIAGAS